MSGTKKTMAKAFAPASVANVAVGFDILGFSVDMAGDYVVIERIEEPQVIIEQISGLVKNLPQDAARNTATAGLVRMIADCKLDFGFKVAIEKGIPLGSGMGGSAASAVAAVVAANALLPRALTPEQLLSYALIGEAQASGSYHADNLAPSLMGGLTLARVKSSGGDHLHEVEVSQIPIPKNLACVLIHPHLSIETKQARGILKANVTLEDHIAQSANLACFVAGCFQSDLKAIKQALKDVIIEPQRAHLIPAFYEVQTAASRAGALGCSISGAGPSVFAWAEGLDNAAKIERAMVAAFSGQGVKVDSWTCLLNTQGARLIS